MTPSAEAEFLRQTFALDGRVAVITGASSGIGAQVAQTLARAGCQVALTARRGDKLEAQAARINAAAARPSSGDGVESVAMAVAMDVNQRRSVEAAVAQVVERCGRLDIVVNNAGIAQSQKFLDMTEHAWQRVVDTDLGAVWRVGQVAARRMAAQKSGGVIINMASILGLAAQRAQTNYGAAKAGVIHLTKTMALELAPHHIRVNALAPGYFATAMNREFLATRRGRDYIAATLPGRPGALAELDGAVLLLASGAGSYINGSVLVVDGGAMLMGL